MSLTQGVDEASLPADIGLSAARRRMFGAALRLFGERGFHAVSVREIAAELGMHPGALYAHVQSKQALLFELIKLGLQKHHDALREALLDAGRDPADQIATLTRAHVLVHLDFPALARVVNRELRSLSEDQQAEIVQIRRATEQLFEDVISRGVALGAFDPVDSGLAIMAIGSLGIRVAEWWTPGSSPSPERIADVYGIFAIQLLRQP